MSSEILRRAAALMRERAEAATPTDLWVRGRDGEDSLHINYKPHVFAVVHGGPAANRDHIASWHPAVALYVAGLLESMADHFEYEALTESACLPHEARALAVARAYLGSAQ